MSSSSAPSEAASLFAKKGQASPAVVPREEAESAYQYLLDMPIVADDRDAETPREKSAVVVEVHASDSMVRLAEPETPRPADALAAEARDKSHTGERATGDSAEAVGSLLALDFRRWHLEEAPPQEAATPASREFDSEGKSGPELRLLTLPEHEGTQETTEAEEGLEVEAADETAESIDAGGAIAEAIEAPAVEPLFANGAPDSVQGELSEPRPETLEQIEALEHSTSLEFEGAATTEPAPDEAHVAEAAASEASEPAAEGLPLYTEAVPEEEIVGDTVDRPYGEGTAHDGGAAAQQSEAARLADERLFEEAVARHGQQAHDVAPNEERAAVVEGAPSLKPEIAEPLRAAFEPSVRPVGAGLETSPRKKWLLPVAASVCLVVAGFYFFGGDGEQIAQDPEVTDKATTSAIPAQEVQPSNSAAGETSTGQDQAGASQVTDSDSAAAADAAAEPARDDQVVASEGAAEQLQNTIGSEAIEGQRPTVDLVRIETDGSAIIAGTAAPGSELIVMDNGQPIGAVVADAVGSWMLMPDRPLPQGDRQISLVLNTPQGSVEIHHEPTDQTSGSEAEAAPSEESAGEGPAAPAQSGTATGVGTEDEGSNPNALDEEARAGPASEKATPGTDDRDEVAALGPPLPVPNPTRNDGETIAEESSAGASNFVVQLSSAKTSVGAAQEWLKLRQKYPEILGNRDVEFNRSQQGSNGIYYRIRTGGFDQKETAQNFCDQLKQLNQDCLVIQR